MIAEGEVHQLVTSNDLDTGEDDYLQGIRAKTAELFAAACEVAKLKSTIVLVRPKEPGPLHAVVAVWLAPQGRRYPLVEAVYSTPPEVLVDEIQGAPDAPPGWFAVIDVVTSFHRPVTLGGGNELAPFVNAVFLQLALAGVPTSRLLDGSW